MENHWLKQILNPGPGKDDCPAMFGEPNEQLLNAKPLPGKSVLS